MHDLGGSDLLFAAVVFFIFIAAVVGLVYVGWRVSKQKDNGD